MDVQHLCSSFFNFLTDSAEGSFMKARAATDFQCVLTAAAPSRPLMQPKHM